MTQNVVVPDEHQYCGDCGCHSRNCWCMDPASPSDYDEDTPEDLRCPGGIAHD